MAEKLYAIARKTPFSYLVAGKPYPFEPASDSLESGSISSELGTSVFILRKGCTHLGGGNWIIKPESKLTARQRKLAGLEPAP